jgi:Asp-tRNA(Asn)/Glu-tRNA(Gln) amidotransferase A subunit family amidase
MSGAPAAGLFRQHAVPDLMARLRDGELSFRDLLDATLTAVAREEPRTRAWVCFDADQLRRESERAWAAYRSRGTLLALDGLPFGVKDIFNTLFLPTEMGSPVWKGFTPGNNARVVDSLLNAGGLIAGKTVTAEFAVHALNETLNPHDPSRTPGTSSSGSAAAVATGMVPFALGKQTAGSIIRPASFCGVWGMKPSFGLIPRTGVLKTTDSLDTVGFVAAHGRSLRAILDCTRVTGPDYPLVYKHVDRRGGFPNDRGGWRVGFVRTHTWEGAAPYARQAVEALAAAIAREDDFTVEELDWPRELAETHAVHETVYNKSLSYYFQNEKRLSSQITPVMSAMIAAGESIDRHTFVSALARQEQLAAALDVLLAPYDLVLSLGTSSAAPDRGAAELPDPSLVWTLGHLPSISVPLFRSPEGLPFSAQCVSRKWNDYLLLQGVEALVGRGVFPAGSQPVPASVAAALEHAE